MNAERIRIVNYKSLAKRRNELDIGDGITVIIGKNESGKTNIVEAFSELNFFRHPYQIEDADKKHNRYSGEDDIVITLTTSDRTEITATTDNISISGGIVEDIKASKELAICLNRLQKNIDKLNLSSGYFLRNDIGATLKKQFLDAFCCSPYLLLGEIKRLLNAADDIEIKAQLSILYELTLAYVGELPYLLVVGKEKENSFKECYFVSDIEELSHTDILSKLFFAAGITIEGIRDALSEKPLATQMLRAGLQRLSQKYSEFSGAPFHLGYEVREGRFLLTAGEGGSKIYFDELSVSQKWQFSLFVDILWRKIKNEHIVFVFDQPGFDMHVNAQKELLQIFKRIASHGHQIIYTTHSPFLLDINDIASMRVVEKENGQTKIYNKIYSGDLLKGSRMETLSPIFEALGAGFSIKQDDQSQRLNVIVEGISDYYYIKAMLFYLGYSGENEPYIVPSVGASNVPNVASILFGWGLPFKAILDYDEEGKNAHEKMQNKLGLGAGETVLYVNGQTKYRAGNDCTIENLLDKSDLAKIHSSLGKRAKALVSREFYDLILRGELTPSHATIENFKALFAALEI